MNLIKQNDYSRIDCDDDLNAFHSYLSLDSNPFYRSLKKEQLITKIHLNNGITFHGEDPRPFFLNGKKYVLTQRFVNNFDDMQNYIVDVDTGEYTLYTVNSPNFSYGKNWTPFVYNNELYIIQKFDPLTIIKDGNIILELDTGLPTFNNFSQYRGGTNGIEISDGKIIGIGHKTLELDFHLPFIWILNFKSKTFEIMDIVTYNYTQRLNDPTSLWKDDLSGKFYISIFESSCLWFCRPIYCRSLIYEIEFEQCINDCKNDQSYRSYKFL